MSELIFSTVHGSHLYGLAHEGSDRDVYYVYEGKGRNLRHAMNGDDDSVRGTLDAFLERAYTGSHQAVEALFSQKKDWAPGMFERYGAMLDRLYIEGGEVFAKYERTIKKFSYGDFKRRRHACRLRLNFKISESMVGLILNSLRHRRYCVMDMLTQRKEMNYGPL